MRRTSPRTSCTSSPATSRTSTRDRTSPSGSSSSAPATRPAASWPRRSCAPTAATAFEVHSAGTEPKGINPLTLRVLAEAGIDASWARSKSVTEFAGQSFDYVITVCDQARQSCPVFPGEGERLHWGYEDPAAAEGTDEERLAVFRRVFTQMGERIHLFIPLALRDHARIATS